MEKPWNSWDAPRPSELRVPEKDLLVPGGKMRVVMLVYIYIYLVCIYLYIYIIYIYNPPMSGVNIPVKITKKYSISTLGLNPRWPVGGFQASPLKSDQVVQTGRRQVDKSAPLPSHPFFQGRKHVKTVGFRGVPKVFFTIE